MLGNRSQKLGDRPYVVGNSGFHCRSRTDRAMKFAVIVPSEIQGKGRSQIRPLLREGVRQSRQSPNLHPHREIVALDMRRTNPIELGSSPLWDRHGIHDFGRGVPLFGVSRGGINFNQLREVNASTQAHMNGIEVGLEAIRSDLKLSLRGFVDLLGKGHGIPRRAPSKMPGENQFGVSLEGDKAIGVSPERVASRIVLLFASDKSPKFVALDIGNGKIANSPFQKTLALLTDQNEQGKNCRVMKARHALGCTDAASLDEKLKGFGCLLQRRVHTAKRRGVIFGEGLGALAAAKALKAVPLLSKFFTAGVAIVAGHRLAFLREQADNEFGSAFAAYPASADLALPVVTSYRQGFLPITLNSTYRPEIARRQISGLSIRRYCLCLTILHEPFQSDVERGKDVLIPLHGKSDLNKVLSNFCWRFRCTSTLQDIAAGIRELHHGAALNFFLQEIAKRSDSFRQSYQTFINYLFLTNEPSKLVLRFFEGFPVIRFDHNGEIVHYV